jgi:hypothetical protein
MKHLKWKHAVWLLLYLGMISTTVLVLLQVRQGVQDSGRDSQRQQEWLEWVEAARQQASGEGPVQRRVPQAEAPPLTLLMEDYFLVCACTSCILATALFLTLMFLVQGSYNRHPATNEEPSGETDHEC